MQNVHRWVFLQYILFDEGTVANITSYQSALELARSQAPSVALLYRCQDCITQQVKRTFSSPDIRADEILPCSLQQKHQNEIKRCR